MLKRGVVAALGAMLLIAGIGAASHWHTRQSTATLHALLLRDTRAELTIARIERQMEANRSQLLQALQHNPGFEWARLHDHPLELHFAAIQAGIAELERWWKAYSGELADDEERRLALAWFQQSDGLGAKAVAAATADLRAGRWEGAEATLARAVEPTYRQSHHAAAELTRLLSRRASVNNAAAAAASATGTAWLIGVFGAAAALAMAAGVLLLRRIDVLRRDADASERATPTAPRQPAAPSTPTTPGDDDAQLVLQEMQAMNDRLHAAIQTVQLTSTQLAAASSQLAATDPAAKARGADTPNTPVPKTLDN